MSCRQPNFGFGDFRPLGRWRKWRTRRWRRRQRLRPHHTEFFQQVHVHTTTQSAARQRVLLSARHPGTDDAGRINELHSADDGGRFSHIY